MPKKIRGRLNLPPPSRKILSSRPIAGSRTAPERRSPIAEKPSKLEVAIHGVVK